MQGGLGEMDVKFTKVEKTLSGMGQLKKLVLGIDYVVSLRWYNIVVKNYTSALVVSRSQTASSLHFYRLTSSVGRKGLAHNLYAIPSSAQAFLDG